MQQVLTINYKDMESEAKMDEGFSTVNEKDCKRA
jgi:hypothetical protein